MCVCEREMRKRERAGLRYPGVGAWGCRRAAAPVSRTSTCRVFAVYLALGGVCALLGAWRRLRFI